MSFRFAKDSWKLITAESSQRTGLSYSVVAHLRWDLRQIFVMAVAEGFLERNPAELLFIPRQCPRSNTRPMTIEEVQRTLAILNLRVRLIARLAIAGGMRPGEIFGLQWGRMERQYADIWQRVYRGDVDSPKTTHSVRWAALSDGVLAAIQEWRELAPNPAPEAWVFPSETLKTPLGRDNC